jgi:hypothetical protein
MGLDVYFPAQSSGGGGAPTDATYLTLTANGDLSAERALIDSSEIDVVDGGASVTLSLIAGSIAYSKIQNVAANKLLGSVAGGAPEEIALTAAGRALIDDADAAAQRTTLGLGTLATQSGTFSGTSSGTNTGDQTITLTGAVTGSGTGSFATTLAAHATSHKSGGGDAIKLDELAAPTDVTTLNATASAHGLLMKLSGSASDVLKGDGTWATVSGTGDVVGPSSAVASEIALFDGTTGKLIKSATGTGLVEVTSGVYQTPVTVTAFAKTVLDDADAATARATLGAAPLDPQHLLLATNASLTAERVFTPGRHMAATDAGAGSTYTLDFDYDADTFSDWDEMFGFPTTGVIISKYCWVESLGGSGTYAQVTGTADHAGVIRATTGATSGNANRAFLGSSSSANPILATDMRKFLFRVAVPTITSVTVACGLGQDMAAASFGTAGVFFIFDPATSANWQFCCRSASTHTPQTSDVAVNAGDWYDLAVTFDGTHWTPTINKAAHSLVASSANEPTSALNFGWVVATNTTAARTFDVDTIAWSLKALGNRYT